MGEKSRGCGDVVEHIALLVRDVCVQVVGCVEYEAHGGEMRSIRAVQKYVGSKSGADSLEVLTFPIRFGRCFTSECRYGDTGIDVTHCTGDIGFKPFTASVVSCRGKVYA